MIDSSSILGSEGSPPENKPYLALQRGRPSEHCCWICPGLLCFSVSREHSRAGLGEKEKPLSEKPIMERYLVTFSHILPVQLPRTLGKPLRLAHLFKVRVPAKGVGFYGPGKEVFKKLVPGRMTAISLSQIEKALNAYLLKDQISVSCVKPLVMKTLPNRQEVENRFTSVYRGPEVVGGIWKDSVVGPEKEPRPISDSCRGHRKGSA